MNLLFICSKNEWRSRTAETIFKNRSAYSIKSAGTSKTARVRVSRKMVKWADLIFVMEGQHKQRMTDFFPDLIESKEIVVLDIPDEFKYMDEDLIQHLEDAVAFYVDN